MDSVALELAPGAGRFLQAYTTQNPTAPRGAFIDAKGRAVAVYDHVRLSEDRSVLMVARTVVERLRQHLKNYLFLTDASLRELPHSVYWDLDGAAVPADSAWVLPQTAGTLFVTTQKMDAPVSGEEFCRFRWNHRIAMQGADYDDPMLLNLNEPGLVSFTKGCYLGQEIMARVHYRSRPPLRLAAVREADCPAELREKMTSRFRDPGTGEVRGFVFLPNA